LGGSVRVGCDPSVVDETLNSGEDGALGASRRTDRHAAKNFDPIFTAIDDHRCAATVTLRETDNSGLVPVNFVPVQLGSAWDFFVFLPQQRTTAVALDEKLTGKETNKNQETKKGADIEMIDDFYTVQIWVSGQRSGAELNVVIVISCPLSLTFRPGQNLQFRLLQVGREIGRSRTLN
jgi:hypothetical protein